MIATLRASINHIRALTPSADLTIIASPEALRMLSDELFPMIGPLRLEHLLGLDVIVREDVPPGEMYVMARSSALIPWVLPEADQPLLARWDPAVVNNRESPVDADAAATLVDLAREGRHDDFMFLAGASGVAIAKREELWDGTRARLGPVRA
jgi:hypothetical protein